MNTLINKTLRVAISMVALSGMLFAANASAQTKVISHDLSAFNAINVADDFDVTMDYGEFSVKLTVDEALADYVQAYVKDNTLYIAYDEKSVPKEVKALYKGKNAPVPVFKAVVYTQGLNDITLKDKATLHLSDELKTDTFSLSATDKSSVKSMNVKASSAKINVAKDADVNISIVTDNNLNVTTANSSKIVVNMTCKNLNIDADGSAAATFSGNATDVTVKMGGSSKTSLSGGASTLKVNGDNSSYLDAINMPVDDAECVLQNSSMVNTKATKDLTVDEKGNSTLNFEGKPDIHIVRVLSSTLQQYSDAKKK